jgi:putative endonuclease
MKSYVYILTNKRRGVLYIGVTSNLILRLYQHKTSKNKSFSYTYNVNKLVYFCEFDDILSAIEHEKRLKRWHRDWKINLIEEFNAEWEELRV